jgi:homoprotocatechuate degradation regulator HpaR
MFLPRDTRRALPIALLRAREVVMARFRPILHARDLTEPQWRVMRVLGEESPLHATEVAHRACVLGPSLSRIVKVLQERTLISRISRGSDAGDGRKVKLAIAPAGEALVQEITPNVQAVNAELENRFGRKRIEHVLDMLDDLVGLGKPRRSGLP